MLLERTNGAAFRAFIAGLAMKRAARELRALENGPLANSIAGIEAQVKNVADRPPISEAAKVRASGLNHLTCLRTPSSNTNHLDDQLSLIAGCAPGPPGEAREALPSGGWFHREAPPRP